jgi:hypothetical protein
MVWFIALVPLLGAVALLYYDHRERLRHRRRKRARREHKGLAMKRDWWIMRWLAGRRQKRLEHRAASRD